MRLRILLLLTILPLAACRFENDTADTERADASPQEQGGSETISVPSRDFRRFDRTAFESGRLDPAWRTYAERDRQERSGAQAPPTGGATQPLTSDFQVQPPPPAGPETPAGTLAEPASITPAALQAPPTLPVPREGGGPDAFRIQVMLDRARFSPGVIDGRWGKNTEKAVYWFQFAHNLPASGEVDRATYDTLVQIAGAANPLAQVTVTDQDLSGPFTPISDDVYEQEKLDCLCPESPLELLSERYHAEPELLEQLNAEADLQNLTPGMRLWVPNVPQIAPARAAAQTGSPVTPGGAGASGTQGVASPGPAAGEVARILISKKGFYLQALDAQGNILYHFPSTLGSEYDPSPDGQYKVTSVHFEPHFHYQPKLFHEVPDTEPEANLPPGPNSPVGLVWMALSKPHYGIHGTAVPETIGYTSSHGCVRLTNWDAVFLANHVRPGTAVAFRE